MNKKDLKLWIGIEALCVLLLLVTVVYGELKNKEAVAAENSKPGVVVSTPTPTTQLEMIEENTGKQEDEQSQKDETDASVSEEQSGIQDGENIEENTENNTEDTDAGEEEVSGEDNEQMLQDSITPVPPLSEEQSDLVQDDMTPEHLEEVEEPEVTPVENTLYAKYDNTKQAWWFRRNTKHEQSGSGEAFNIEPYDAYYLNEQATEEDKVFYLTFDCGYEIGFTPTILDVLKKYEVPAMFFVTQDFLTSHPDYVKRMKEEGHLVGNHTVRHLSTPDLTPEEIQKELSTVAETMLSLTGYEIDSFFRPPMGEYSERTLQVTKDLGYKSIFWSIAYYDYDVNNQPGKDYVVEHFRDYHHNGCIALLHNTSQSNTEALEDVILLLQEEGYRFGTLLELE